MDKGEESLRIEAIKCYLGGEEPSCIYSDLDRSKSWFFKWLNRYQQGDHHWYKELSRAPKYSHRALDTHTEKLIIQIRRRLEDTKYAQIGVGAIAWELTKLNIDPPPAWTINRVLKRNNLIKKRKKVISLKGRITLPLRPMRLIGFTRQTSLGQGIFKLRSGSILLILWISLGIR